MPEFFMPQLLIKELCKIQGNTFRYMQIALADHMSFWLPIGQIIDFSEFGDI